MPLLVPVMTAEPDTWRRYRPHPDVATEAVEEELLLVQLAQGTAFRLNRTGKAIWEMAVTGLSAREIAEQLHTSLSVSSEQLTRDASALLEELSGSALLEPQSEAA